MFKQSFCLGAFTILKSVSSGTPNTYDPPSGTSNAYDPDHQNMFYHNYKKLKYFNK